MRRSARPPTPGGTGIDSELAPSAPVWAVVAFSKLGLGPQLARKRLVATVAHQAMRRGGVRELWANQPRIERMEIPSCTPTGDLRTGQSITPWATPTPANALCALLHTARLIRAEVSWGGA